MAPASAQRQRSSATRPSVRLRAMDYVNNLCPPHILHQTKAPWRVSFRFLLVKTFKTSKFMHLCCCRMYVCVLREVLNVSLMS